MGLVNSLLDRRAMHQSTDPLYRPPNLEVGIPVETTCLPESTSLGFFSSGVTWGTLSRSGQVLAQLVSPEGKLLLSRVLVRTLDQQGQTFLGFGLWSDTASEREEVQGELLYGRGFNEGLPGVGRFLCSVVLGIPSLALHKIEIVYSEPIGLLDLIG